MPTPNSNALLIPKCTFIAAMTPMPSIPPAAASALAYRRWLMHDDAASMMTTPASMTAADMRARPRLTPCLAAWTAYLTFVQKVRKPYAPRPGSSPLICTSEGCTSSSMPGNPLICASSCGFVRPRRQLLIRRQVRLSGQ